jgi:Na+/proline symporter
MIKKTSLSSKSFTVYEEIKTFPVLLFAALSVLAGVTVILKDRANSLAFIGMSIGILLLIWLIIGITKKFSPSDFEIKTPGWELLAGFIFILIWELDPLRFFYLSLLPDFSDKW